MQVFCFFKGLFGLLVKYKIKGHHQLMALLVESPGKTWYHITRDKEWCVYSYISVLYVSHVVFLLSRIIDIRIMLITLFKLNHFSEAPPAHYSCIDFFHLLIPIIERYFNTFFLFSLGNTLKPYLKYNCRVRIRQLLKIRI